MNDIYKLLNALDTMIGILESRKHLLSPYECRMYRLAKEEYEQVKAVSK